MFWFLLAFLLISLKRDDSTIYTHASTHVAFQPISADAPEVYYINMDNSIERRRHIENHLHRLGLRYFRVRGNPWQDIYIPNDVNSLWRTPWCYLDSEENLPSREEVMRNESSPLRNFTSVMAGLCGRGLDRQRKERNSIKELGCTTSQINAITQAIESTTATSKYESRLNIFIYLLSLSIYEFM